MTGGLETSRPNNLRDERLLGELIADVRTIKTDVQEIKRCSRSRDKWISSVESRLSAHDVEIQNLKEHRIEFRDTSPTLKITITAGGALGGISIFLGILYHFIGGAF